VKPGWNRTALSAIATIVGRGIAPKYSESGDFIVINQRCIRGGRVKLENARTHDSSLRAVKELKQLVPGDILVNSTGVGTLGRTAPWRGADNLKVTVDSHVTIVRPRRSVHPRWLAYALSIAEPLIESLGRGSTGQTELAANSLAEMQLLYPPLLTQKHIANILGALDDKIDSNHQAARESEALAFALFEKLATAEIRFNDIARVVMGASPPGSSYNEAGDGVPFFQGVRDFTFRFPKRRVFTSMPKHLAAPGDILLSVRAPVGRLNVAVDQCCIGRGLAAIRSEVSSTCYYALRNMDTEWKKYEAQGTVFGSLNKASLKALKLPWPEPSMIKLLESHLNTLDSYISQKEQESRKLAELRDTLLPELMSGRMRVDEAGRLVAGVLGEEPMEDAQSR